MSSQRPNLVVIGNTHSNPSTRAFLAKFARLTRELGKRIYFVTADPPPLLPGTQWIETKAKYSENLPMRYLLFLECQLALCMMLMRMRRDYSESIVLATPFLMPVITLKALGKRVALFLDGRPEKIFSRALCRLNFSLANILMVEAWILLDSWGIRSRKKARHCALYVDTTVFRCKRALGIRGSVVGYLGRLEEGKGISELLAAIRLLNEREEEIEYLIGGSGQIEEQVRRFAQRCQNVNFRGQIPWESMSDALNECRLIVIPSHAEGLPNILLEAMACGTPVLATPVGGVIDIIQDGENGFLLPDNSASTIAAHILRVLRYGSLDQVARRASETITSEFVFERALERYRQVVEPQGSERGETVRPGQISEAEREK